MPTPETPVPTVPFPDTADPTGDANRAGDEATSAVVRAAPTAVTARHLPLGGSDRSKDLISLGLL